MAALCCQDNTLVFSLQQYQNMFFTWIQSSTMAALCACKQGDVYFFLHEANVVTLKCDRKLIATVGGVQSTKYTQSTHKQTVMRRAGSG